MSNKGDCRTALATPGLLNILPYSTLSQGLFFTNQEAQLCLLLVLRYVLLPHLFISPKFPYGSHLYVGAVQIETFCFKSLEKLTEGKKHLFRIL